MRIRVVISGIVAGVVCQFILKSMVFSVRFGRILPGWIVSDSPISIPNWLEAALIGLAVFTVFVFGWVAARWNWSRTWNASFLSGAGSGLIAAALAYCLVGAFHAGVEGQIGILTSLTRHVDENEGMILLLNGLTKTSLTIYSWLGLYLLVGVTAGALGGLASLVDRNDVWGKPVPAQDPTLFRLSAYGLSVSGFLNLIVVVAVFQLLEESASKAVSENNLWNSIVYPPVLIYVLALYAGILMLCTPLALTWGWTLRDWIVERKRAFASALWVLVTFGFVSYSLVKYVMEYNPIGILVFVPVAGIVLFLGIIGTIGWNIKPPPESEWTPYRFSDLLGYLLTCGILGGVQIIAGAVAYSLSIVLIAIVDIPHLMNMEEPVTSTMVEQVYELYGTLLSSSLYVMAASAVIALVFRWLDKFVRWMFVSKKKPIPAPTQSDWQS